ncbi:MAG TPA: hypothetical protein VLZ83_02280 [Edaphocola sp.]|nr:hypothetical protein [Edaphocola sp.]
MTQLGGELPEQLIEIRNELSKHLEEFSISEVDASSFVTGGDFMIKIWEIILSVPLGIAVVSEGMKESTLSNIFYEIGLLNSLGKESIIIKSKDYKIPSDFVRTEYIEFNSHFSTNIDKFLNNMFELADHYDLMSELLEKNPVLSIDYLRRAYLITNDLEFKEKAKTIYKENSFDNQSNFFVKNFINMKDKRPTTRGHKTLRG